MERYIRSTPIGEKNGHRAKPEKCRQQKTSGFSTSFDAPGRGVNLMQRAQYVSCGNEVDDFVLGVECIDDGAQARLTLLRAPLTRQN